MAPDRSLTRDPAAPAAIARPRDVSPGLPTRAAEAVVRFGLPAFILTLPLEFTSEIFRLQLARIVLGVVGVAYAYLVLAGRRQIVIPLAPSSIVLGVFVAISVLSWLLTRAPGSRNALADVVLYPLVAILIVSMTRTPADHRNAWIAFLVSGLAIALLVAFLHFTSLSIWRPDPATLRVNATFGDPNVAARFLTLAACAGIMLFAGRMRPYWLAIAAAMAAAAFTAFTLSKSALLVFPVAIVIAAAFASNRRRAATIGAVALIVFGASVVSTNGASARVLRAFEQITGGAQAIANPTSGTTNPQINSSQLDLVRVYLINAGWQMFLDHPVTGVGFGGYQHAITTTYKRFLPAQPPATLSHTAMVTLLAEEGAVGFLTFFAFLLLLAWEALAALRRGSDWRDWVVIPAVLVLPILAYSQVEGRMIEEPYLWLLLGLMYSALTLERSARSIRVPS